MSITFQAFSFHGISEYTAPPYSLTMGFSDRVSTDVFDSCEMCHIDHVNVWPASRMHFPPHTHIA